LFSATLEILVIVPCFARSIVLGHSDRYQKCELSDRTPFLALLRRPVFLILMTGYRSATKSKRVQFHCLASLVRLFKIASESSPNVFHFPLMD
jgi:hypothetical protein